MTFPAEEPTRTQTTPPNNSSTAKRAAPPRRRTRVKPKAGPAIVQSTTTVRTRSMAVRPRPGSKTAKLLALLKRPRGASLKELLKATGWQPHSIRGFLSGTVGRKMGLKISSIRAESGERRYAVKA
jgi:hypothetical protein